MPPRSCSEPHCPEVKPCPTHPREAWAGSKRRDELPRNWAKIRKQVKTRDKWRCVICGGRDRLEVDHLGDPHDHRPDNLQTLCHDCHQRKTQGQARRARYGTH